MSLPKWPCLIVVGEKVTKEQAEEILVRTDLFAPDLEYAGNDRSVCKKYTEIFGLSVNEEFDAKYKKIREIRKKFGLLNLSFLYNQQIISSYIGGPHGWCNWSGDIFCNSYNIGKWPEVVSVKEDWQRIARAFPFLNLKSQLLSGECCEDDAKPVVEFHVESGEVSQKEPAGFLVPQITDAPLASIAACFTVPSGLREVGINADSLKKIIGRLEEKNNEANKA